MNTRKLLSVVLLVVMCFALAIAASACKKTHNYSAEPDTSADASISASEDESAGEQSTPSQGEQSTPSQGEASTSDDTPATATLESLTLKSAPDKKEYAYGEQLDLTGAFVTVTYDDETAKDIAVTAEMVSGYSATTAGKQTLTVTYAEDGTALTAEFEVTVAERLPVATALTLKSAPDKTEYAYGEDLDLTGAFVTVTYDDETAKDIAVTAEMVSGYSATTAGKQTLTVTYTENEVTLTTEFEVEVAAAGPMLESLVLTASPKGRILSVGQNFNVNGFTLFASYDDETTEEVALTEDMVTGYDKNVAGEQTVTFTYASKSVEYTAKVVDDYTFVKGTADAWEITEDENGSRKYVSLTDNAMLIFNDSSFTGGSISFDMKIPTTEFSNLAVTGIVYAYTVNAEGKQQYYVTGRSSKNGNFTSYRMPGTAFEKGGAISDVMDNLDETYHLKFIWNSAYKYVDGNGNNVVGGCAHYFLNGEFKSTTVFTVALEAKGQIGLRALNAGAEFSNINVSIEDELSGIEIVHAPDKTEYNVGEELDLEGLVVNALYYAGNPTEIEVFPSMISGYDKTKVGTQEITVTYTRKGVTVTATFTVKVTAPDVTITGVEMKTAPAKTLYNLTDTLDLTGAAITATYSNGSTEDVTVTAEMVSGFDSTTAGVKTVTVTYEGMTTSFTVKVTDDYVFNNGSLNAAPTSDDFIITEDENGSRRYTFVGEKYASVMFNKVEFTGGTISYKIKMVGTPGTWGVGVVYGSTEKDMLYNRGTYYLTGFNKNAYLKTYERNPSLGSIDEESAASQITDTSAEYAITVIWDYSSHIRTYINGQLANDIELASSLTGKYVGLYFPSGLKGTEIYDVVFDDAVILDGIAVTNTPKTNYNVGEELDLTGMTVKATYLTRPAKILDLSELNVTGYDKDTIGEQTITVSYTENGVTKTATFTVSVVTAGVTLEGIALVAIPTRTLYNVTDTLDMTGAKITATYSDGSTKELDVTTDMITGFDNAVAGTQTLTVNYEGKTTSFTVKVIDDYNFTDGTSADWIITEDENGSRKFVAATDERIVLTFKNVKFVSGSISFKLSVPDNDYNYIVGVLYAADTLNVSYTVGNAYGTGRSASNQRFTSMALIQDKSAPGWQTNNQVSNVISDVDTIYDMKIIWDNNEHVHYYLNGEYLATATLSYGLHGEYVGLYVGKCKGAQIYDVVIDGNDVLDSLTITAPEKVTYNVGEELDLTGMTATASYLTCADKQLETTALTLTGYDKDTVGEQTVTVSYTENGVTKTATFTVSVVAAGVTLEGAALKSAPAKTTYNYSDELDLTGAYITLTYSDESTRDVEMTSEMISGFDSTKPGVQTITATYTEGEQTFDVTFEVTVTNYHFILGSASDLVITTDENGVTKFTSPTTTAVSMIFKGEYFNGGSVSFDLMIPTLTEYSASSTNVTGIMYAYNVVDDTNKYYVTGRVYNSGNYTSYRSSPFAWENTTKATGVMTDTTKTYHVEFIWDPTYVNAEGKNTGRVHYFLDGEYLCTNEFKEHFGGGEVGIHFVNKGAEISNLRFDPTAKLSGLEVSATKTEYALGEDIDLTTVTAIPAYYFTPDEVTAIDADKLTITGYDKNTVGEQTVTFSYTENGRTASAELKIKVYNENATLESIAVTTAPAKTLYNLTDELVIDGAKITATYSDASTAEYNVTADMVTGFDSATAGVKTVTVTYEDKTATFTVKVIDDYVFNCETDIGTATTSNIIVTEDENGSRKFTLASDAYCSVLFKNVEFTSGSISFKMKYPKYGNTWVIGVIYGANTYNAQYAKDKFYATGCSANGYLRTVQRNTAMTWQDEEAEACNVSTVNTEYSVKIIWDGNQHVHYYINGQYVYTSALSKKLTGKYVGVYFPSKCAGSEVYDIVLDATETQPALLNDLTLDAAPAKLRYAVGEELDLTGMTATATYLTGEAAKTVDNSAFVLTGYDKDTEGNYTVTATYTENGISKAVTFAVTYATETLTLTALTLKNAPTKTTYTVGEELDLTGAAMTATYDNGTSEEISIAADMITTAFSTEKIGTYTLTASYTAGEVTMTVNFDVTVTTTEGAYKLLFVGSDLITGHNTQTAFANLYKAITGKDVYSESLTSGSFTIYEHLTNAENDLGMRERLAVTTWDAVIIQISRRITQTGTELLNAEKAALATILPTVKANTENIYLFCFNGASNPTVYTVDEQTGTTTAKLNEANAAIKETSTRADNSAFYVDLATAWAEEYDIGYIPYGPAYDLYGGSSSNPIAHIRACCIYDMLTGTAVPEDCTEYNGNSEAEAKLYMGYAKKYCLPEPADPEAKTFNILVVGQPDYASKYTIGEVFGNMLKTADAELVVNTTYAVDTNDYDICDLTNTSAGIGKTAADLLASTTVNVVVIMIPRRVTNTEAGASYVNNEYSSLQTFVSGLDDETKVFILTPPGTSKPAIYTYSEANGNATSGKSTMTQAEHTSYMEELAYTWAENLNLDGHIFFGQAYLDHKSDTNLLGYYQACMLYYEYYNVTEIPETCTEYNGLDSEAAATARVAALTYNAYNA